MLRLGAHDATAPSLAHILIAIGEAGVTTFNDLCQLCLILRANVSECNCSGDLDVDGLTQASRAPYNAVRYIHLAAKCWKPDDELNGINIVRDHNKGGLLLLDKFSDMVDTKFEADGLLSTRSITTRFASLTELGQTLGLLNRGLRLVLGHELEEGARSGGIHGEAELVDCRRDLETHEKDLTLTLEAHVFGPLDVAAERNTTGKHVLSDAKVLGALLE